MCGICGKVLVDRNATVLVEQIERMANAIHHRGPDDTGMYVSGHVGLGHRRLSIIDLNTGKQPITNENMTIWIVFNGEIYNYVELRKELLQKSHTFKTCTDTEVIVHLYEEYGIDCVAKLRGMFAFAIWDEMEERLFIARDRVGIKPLYYYIDNKSIIFGSEIKAILQDPSVNAVVNVPILDRYLTYLYAPGEETLFKNIYKLRPGHYMVYSMGKCRINEYWDLDFSYTKSNLTIKDAKEQLIELLRESVKLHMISDAPIGILLSGGMDSTSLLSLMAEETLETLSSFTIGFKGEDFADERWYAGLVAKKFRTNHYELTISPQDFGNFLPEYIWHMEEPVCEPPAIALYYISKLAKDYVKVLISGEGGDEIFAGYQTYRNIVWLERLKKMPFPINKSILSLLKLISKIPQFKKIDKYVPLFEIPLDQYYYSLRSNPISCFNSIYYKLYSDDYKNQIDKQYSIEPTSKYFSQIQDCDDLTKMLYVDTKTWLPDDLLIKADKMSMANSIELRVPLLDHKIMEFAASLPSSYKLNRLTTKYILKETLREKIPKEIVDRKKTGFPVPYDKWLKNELSHCVNDLLFEKKTVERGYFNAKEICKLIEQHKNGLGCSAEVFQLIIVELWHRAFIDNQSNAS